MERDSSCKIKKICVFCGFSAGESAQFADVAFCLGKILAERKILTTLSGGSFGLMGCVSTGACVGGSNVLAIIPRDVPVMHDKIAKMVSLVDGFIALPGGLGTLEEIFQAISLTPLRPPHKPIGLLNINGFYDGLISFLDHAVEQKVMTQTERSIFLSAPTAGEMIDQLQAFHTTSTASPKDESDKQISKKPRLDVNLSL